MAGNASSKAALSSWRPALVVVHPSLTSQQLGTWSRTAADPQRAGCGSGEPRSHRNNGGNSLGDGFVAHRCRRALPAVDERASLTVEHAGTQLLRGE